jgi:predicted ATPase/DNA-binding CsgD family transcriptional regulator
LPDALSSFIGREREIAEVVTLIERARLVTLTGPGGSGKTRLAIEAARRAAGAMHLPAAFVDLAPISDPGLISSSIAAGLAIRPEPSQTLDEALLQDLGDRSLLLVLDNLEQLLPDAGTTLIELAGSCPGLRLLATSRAPIHVRGEQEYLVEPLVQAEALALFRDRAREVDSRFEVTDQNSAAIEEICRRFDGLPLAIELAAARSKVLSPEALLRRLALGDALPASVAVDAPARQRTLRDAIAWSFDLLNLDERRVFSRVSVFVGGFTADAAAEVVPDPRDEPIDVGLALDRLVDHSLVQVGPGRMGEPRFRVLETVREFGLSQLSDDELDHVRRRHLQFFNQSFVARTSYEAAPSPDDIGNVRAALSWAESNGDAAMVASLGVAAWLALGLSGYREEAGHWLAAAERASSEAGPVARAGLLQQLARYELAYGGDRKRAQDLLSQSLTILEDTGDPMMAVRTLELLSHVASDLGERHTAAERMDQAIARVRGLEDRVRRARVLAEIAGSGSAVHSLTEMQALAEEALGEGRAFDDGPTMSDATLALGYVALAKGELPIAVGRFTESLHLCLNLAWIVAQPACSLAIAQLRLRDLDSSRSLLFDALPQARDLAVTWIGLTALEAAADWLGAAGQHTQAVMCWATIDATRGRTLDRTFGNDLGIFDGSRERDRKALRPDAWQAATAAGREMTLDQGIAFAMAALDEVDLTAEKARRRPGRYQLTPREREVLTLVAAGRSDGQIAEELFISKSTAAVHVANIKGKLGATSRVEIATTAIERRLVEPPEAIGR